MGVGSFFTCGGGGGAILLGVILKILIGFGGPFLDKKALPGGVISVDFTKAGQIS